MINLLNLCDWGAEKKKDFYLKEVTVTLLHHIRDLFHYFTKVERFCILSQE